MLALRFHPDAINEARDARLYYSDIAPALGEDFMRRLDDAMLRVAEQPLAYEAGRRGERRCRLVRFPYAVVFLVRGEFLDVIAIAHGRRRPGYWRHRST